MWWTFYQQPPRHAIALDQLEHAAELRLSVLRVLAAASLRTFHTAADLPLSAQTALNVLDDDEEQDVISHYVLRLAFCKYV